MSILLLSHHPFLRLHLSSRTWHSARLGHGQVFGILWGTAWLTHGYDVPSPDSLQDGGGEPLGEVDRHLHHDNLGLHFRFLHGAQLTGLDS